MSDQDKTTELPQVVTSLARLQAPVIVTFGEGGEVVDTFGEAQYYAETQDALGELLGNLLVGWQERIETLSEVEMPSGKYADVRIVPEGSLRHVILFDVTAAVTDRREILQASHEMALSEQHKRIRIERDLGHHQGRQHHGRGDWQGADVIEMLSWDIRARLDEIQGHAQLLDRVAKPGAEAHSVVCIKRASMHLQALASACIVGLRDGLVEAVECEPVGISRLVAELRAQFGDSAEHPKISFETQDDLRQEQVAETDYARVHQILACLITCFLDITGEPITVRVDIDGDCLVAEVQSDSELGADVAFRELSDDPRYIASHHLAGTLKGRLVCLNQWHAAVRLELPLAHTPATRRRSEQSGERRASTVLVAVEPPKLRERVLDQLSKLGLSGRVCDELALVELQAGDPDVAMIVLGGGFAGAAGMGLSYRLHAGGIGRRTLLLRSVAGLGRSAWVFDGRRAVISAEADDEVLRTAIEGVLQA